MYIYIYVVIPMKLEPARPPRARLVGGTVCYLKGVTPHITKLKLDCFYFKFADGFNIASGCKETFLPIKRYCVQAAPTLLLTLPRWLTGYVPKRGIWTPKIVVSPLVSLKTTAQASAVVDDMGRRTPESCQGYSPP